MKDDRYVKNRRVQLKKWFDVHPIPVREKSYISQLIGGTASFGSRAARRLEVDYRMGEFYLEHQDDVDIRVLQPKSTQDDVIALLSGMDDDEIDLWCMTMKIAAKKARKSKQKEDREKADKAHDPPTDRRRAACS